MERDHQAHQDDGARAVHLFDRIATVAEALTAELSTSEILRVLMRHGMAGLGAEGSSVSLVDPSGFLARLAATGTVAEQHSSSGLIPLDRQLPLTEAARTGSPVFVGSAADAMTRFADLTTDHADCRCSAAVPLVVGGRVSGVFGVAFRDDRDFPPIEQRFIVTVANVGAHALMRDLSFGAAGG